MWVLRGGTEERSSYSEFLDSSKRGKKYEK
jgi:hypothetical protein